MAKKITPPEFDDLAKVFGAGTSSKFAAHEKTIEAINSYVETGIPPDGSNPNWDWEELAWLYYVPAWHAVSLLKRLVFALERR